MTSRYRKPDDGLKRYDYALTLDEIARELGVTRERARQIEARALIKAKQILERSGYTLQDLLPDEARNGELLQDLAPEGECND